jgi:hypothetical protein
LADPSQSFVRARSLQSHGSAARRPGINFGVLVDSSEELEKLTGGDATPGSDRIARLSNLL